jgi:hypothetical protein
MAEGEVNPVDEAKAMQAGIKEKSLALRQKLGKLTTIANPELGDYFLVQVIIILLFLFKSFLNDILLMTCFNSFSLFETSGEALCH